MQITEVRVFPVDEDKLKAYASIVVDACFIVNDLKIIEGKRGLFISMPSRRRKRGGYRDVAHPLNNETRRLIEERVLAEYERALGEVAAGLRVVTRDEDDHDAAGDHRGEPQRDWAPVAAAPAVAPIVATVLPEPVPEPPPPAEPKSLEEVEKLHLRDSFWSVT
jgi:stage V sporulation protein G